MAMVASARGAPPPVVKKPGPIATAATGSGNVQTGISAPGVNNTGPAFVNSSAGQIVPGKSAGINSSNIQNSGSHMPVRDPVTGAVTYMSSPGAPSAGGSAGLPVPVIGGTLGSSIQLLNNGIARAGALPTLAMNNTQLDMTQADQARAGQLGLIGMLTNAANGGGPSAAQALLRQATDQSLNQQAALASTAMMHGANTGSALRDAMDQQAAISQNANQQASILRAQEQQAAQQQLGNVLSGVRGQDLGAAGTNAGLTQQTNALNLQTAAGQQQFREGLMQKYMQMGLDAQTAQMQADRQLAIAQLASQTQFGIAGINAGVQTAAQDKEQAMQILGATTGAAGSLGAAGLQAASNSPSSVGTLAQSNPTLANNIDTQNVQLKYGG